VNWEVFKELTPFLTILGWGIVLYNTDRISLRNESRSAIDGCIKKIEDIIELTYEFIHYENDAAKGGASAHIKRGQRRSRQYEDKVSSLISCIETKNSYLYKRTNKEFIDEFSLIQMRIKFDPKSDDLDEAIETALDITSSLEEKFSKRFSKKWYHFIPFWIRLTFIIGIWCLLYFGMGSYFIGSPFS
jgi:hypothetical protein